MPMIDLGRPDRIPHLFIYGRWQSPILWDMLAISTYLVASIAYLYLPMIPDLAIARDRLGDSGTNALKVSYLPLRGTRLARHPAPATAAPAGDD